MTQNIAAADRILIRDVASKACRVKMNAKVGRRAVTIVVVVVVVVVVVKRSAYSPSIPTIRV